MRLESVAAILTAGLVLFSSSCSGKSDSSDSMPMPMAGADSGGGSAGAAQAGKSAGGASGAGDAGSANGGRSSGGTSNHDQPDCEADFDALDKSCASASDCRLVQHQIDCCGTILIMGLASAAEPGFAAIEQYCAAQFPPCGCASRGMMLEDGSLIDFGSKDAVAECVDGRCRSRSSTPTIACGTQRCTQAQYCEELVGGPAGSEPSYACRPLGDCRDCACLNVTACQCSENDGAIKVFCAAP
jgi:hypothetical protein